MTCVLYYKDMTRFQINISINERAEANGVHTVNGRF